MARKNRKKTSARTWLVVVVGTLALFLAAAGEGASSIVATLVAGVVVVWLVYGVIFRRRR
jgi:fatty acid desaturase